MSYTQRANHSLLYSIEKDRLKSYALAFSGEL